MYNMTLESFASASSCHLADWYFAAANVVAGHGFIFVGEGDLLIVLL